MNEQTASLIIRMQLALADEGIGPRRATVDGEYVDQSDADNAVYDEAVRVAGHLFHEHFDLWDARLIPDEVHFPRCIDYRH